MLETSPHGGREQEAADSVTSSETTGPENATIVLFGGTGDLARRKLFPALFDLWKQGDLPDCVVIGIGRRVDDTAAYRELIREGVDAAEAHPDDWKRFAEHIEFHHGDIMEAEDFEALRKRVEELEQQRQFSGNRLFYYAVGPELFAPITEQLAASGLLRRAAEERTGNAGWSRIVVEKPFGHDLVSAEKLDATLHAHVDESQIYRIDHYLGKETVQNIIAFRFANGLIEPVWNHKYVDHVQITMAESVGVENRAAFYEKAGALRDVMQNHMLQLLAVTAMEPPNSLDPEAVRTEKLKTLHAIRLPANAEEVEACTVRGQYGSGSINGEKVPGYRQEADVAADSNTPTFVAARLYLDTWRWAGVPFLLRHGKRMAKRATEIAVQFRTPPLALFRGTDIPGRCTNLLMIRIQPDEGISLRFGAKRPGGGMHIANVQMDFGYEESFNARIPDAYERLLIDALTGDPTLFTRSDEVRAMWRWADAVQEGWEAIGPPRYPNYAAGSWGPPEADRLFSGEKAARLGFCLIGWRQP